MKNFSFCVLAVSTAMLSAMGCSSSGSSAPGADDGGTTGEGGGSATCTPVALSAVPGVPTGSVLVDLAVDDQGAWLLVRASKGALSLVRPTGEVKVLEAADATAAGLSPRSDGKVCAAWGVSKPSADVRYACGPEFTAVSTNTGLTVDDGAPLAFRDEPTGGAILFEGKFASLDGISREGTKFRDADVSESSISYPGGVHALAGAGDGAPYCFVADEGSGAAPIVVASWSRSGSANDWGSLSLDGSTAATHCAAAFAGPTLGVLATGGGKAKFATGVSAGGFAGKLAPEAFDAPDLTVADLAADKDGFTVVYGTKTAAFRAVRGASGWEAAPLQIPGGAAPTAVAIAKDASGEHVALQAGSAVYYQRSCR
ncbi:MAG: hypothetical protein JWP97_1962 [Labilithrix sp.]|nr:hypothetical protein [Labilithrix sp.]